jgi:hypothetical protein
MPGIATGDVVLSFEIRRLVLSHDRQSEGGQWIAGRGLPAEVLRTVNLHFHCQPKFSIVA